MVVDLGRRERKKQQTRQLIFQSASRLFTQRGFDSVTVAEVADTADVSEMTVFNHFPTKEDLVFSGLVFFEEQLLDAVRERAPGESALTAFRRQVLGGFSRLARAENVELIAKAAELISTSPALLAREREIVAGYTQQLATALAEEMGARVDDVEAWGVASALMGTHRALVAHVRERVLAGKRGRPLEAEARSQAIRAFARFESGLASYATGRM